MTEGEARRQVARGANRAGGERAVRQRRTTPLLAGREPVVSDSVDADQLVPDQPVPDQPVPAEPAAAQPAEPVHVDEAVAETAEPVEKPEQPVEKPEQPVEQPFARASRRTIRVKAAASRRTAGGKRLVAVADAAKVAKVADSAKVAGAELADALPDDPSQLPDDHVPDALEQRLADALAFLRRRLTGEFTVDEFGFDPELTDTVLLNLFRPLYRKWFRVEVRGVENIPSTGGALVVANHSGAIALDALMTTIAVRDEHPAHRHLRLLGADFVFSTPVLGELARKGGATLASNADAERLLSSGEVVAVWPEGFKGIGKPFSERYKLQRFGRGGFVSAALRTGTPIVPCAIVGAEETYPIIGNMPSLARLLGLPYAPITPTWPLLGPLGLIPLPSKWLIEFCPPVPVHPEPGPAAAEDPMTVFDLTDQVRQTIQQTLYSLLVQRRSVFF